MAVTARRVSFGMGRKYHNKPTITNVSGKPEKFASLREADRYRDLLLLLKADRIRNLDRQVPFRIEVGGKLVCKYLADFVYDEYQGGNWVHIVEDVKGFMTPVYRLKKKLMAACLNIDIREV